MMRYICIAAACVALCGCAAPPRQATTSQQSEHVDTAATLRQTEEPPAPSEIASHVRARLASLDRLDVVSTQRVSYARRPLTADIAAVDIERNASKAIAALPDVASVNLRIASSMTRNSFEVKMWKEGLPQPVTELSLFVSDGVPMITERQWYPVFNDYRSATYPSKHREGIDDLAIPSCLFQELKTRVCATAEFFQTWLDESWQADSFETMLNESVVLKEEIRQGRRAYVLKRRTYEDDTPELYQAATHVFWVDAERYSVLAWKIELADIRFGHHAAYQVVEAEYEFND